MANEGPIDLLRLSPEAQERLLADLQKASERSDATMQRRSHKRHDYRQRSVNALIQHPGGTVTRCVVSSRNLSAGGLGFLHGSFLHTGTACVVFLTKTSGQTVPLRGAVASCRHIRGRVHEIGLQFEDTVDPGEFMALDPADAAETPEGAPASEAGAGDETREAIVLLTSDADLAATVGRALHDAPRPTVSLAPTTESIDSLRQQAPSVVLLDARSAAEAPPFDTLREAAGDAPIVAIAPQADQAPDGVDAVLMVDASDEDIRSAVLGLLEVSGDPQPRAAA